MQAEEIFDITDGRNRYEPCPKCGIDFLMGISSNGKVQYVICGKCDHRGPSVELPPQGEWETWPVDWHERDRLAFEGWNEESRRERSASPQVDDTVTRDRE